MLGRGLAVTMLVAAVVGGGARIPATIAAFTGTTQTPSSTWASSPSWAKLWGTGGNTSGQLGTPTYRATPNQVETATDWATVTTGSSHTCAGSTHTLAICAE